MSGPVGAKVGAKRGPDDTLQFRTDRPGFVESFWSRVVKWTWPNDCWIWDAARNGLGYGIVWNGEKLLLAHRVSWTLTHGQIPRGVVIDHVCRNVACVNPTHLQLVTQRENTLRGISPNAIAHRTNTCKRGHSLEDARLEGGRRRCRQCSTIRTREYRAAKRASA